MIHASILAIRNNSPKLYYTKVTPHTSPQHMTAIFNDSAADETHFFILYSSYFSCFDVHK